MFNRRLKKKQIAPENIEGDKSRQRSNGRFTISEVPATKTSAEKCDRKWYRLFGQPLSKIGSLSRTVKRVIFSSGPATTTAPPPEEDNQRTKKKTSCWGLFNCCRRRRRDDEEDEQKHNSSSVIIQNDQVVEFKGLSDEEEAALDRANEENKKGAATGPKHAVFSSLLEAAVDKVICHRQDAVNPQSLKAHQAPRFGFPNQFQTCYMNASLQSLITLTEFITDIYSHKHLWNYISDETELIRHFVNIVRCHGSEDVQYKLQALYMFKKALSVRTPEFEDNYQKDAHEFLTAFLNQMRSLASPLQKVAALTGRSYSCPVDRNLVFKMQNTRTCKRCGAQSIREEEFTNLSLDLVPGGSVQQMLKEYQMETELKYNCECGCNTSVQCSTFLTLPRFLIIHLKRFRFTPSLQVVKLHDPVVLFRPLMVTTSQADGCYNLVSVISHLGYDGNNGHYISEGVYPGQDLSVADDQWLYYNDAQVAKTTGAAVCKRDQQTAYIVFYQRSIVQSGSGETY
ncbi:ubiquitin carboxyl-terminal hydrolase 37-like isoform X1 [Etheostoma cragini]|uniref:ubiquitin carboxyl-terminal hydrolase 37-like isoform X1 n=1 Tax=Etheostoma cragini TaxID=417921 RepID=UPI00155DEEE1|nr:ubiquitin carboxyl-terminal hydrolase 37-like isoform X1 [Etheostoma cragini]